MSKTPLRSHIDNDVAYGVQNARNERALQQRLIDSHVEQRAKIMAAVTARHAERAQGNRGKTAK